MSRIGLRGRLAGAIAAILVVALGLTFFAVQRGTESELDQRLDEDLAEKASEFEIALRVAQPATAAETLAEARRFVASQSFGPNPQLIAIQVPGAGTATNQPELLGLQSLDEGAASPPAAVIDEGEDESGDGEGDGESHEGEEEGEEEADEERDEGERIRAAPEGYSEVSLDEAGEVRILTRSVPSYPGGAPATVRVGEPSASVERALDGLESTLLVVGAAALALGIAAGALVAARTVAPLRRMSRTAGQIDAGELSQRLEVPRAKDEVRTLAVAFNGMLERLEDAFERQRRFVADASHELRTPLTVIRGQLEVLARSRRAEPEDVSRVSGVVSGEVDRMERMIGDLLALAKADREPVAKPRRVELARLAREVFGSLQVTAERSFEIVRSDSGAAMVDPDLFAQLIRILTRNAIEHTDPSGRIALSVSRDGEGWEISIDDDGPGIPEEERAKVFERFYRIDESRNRAEGGAGLGLAIAKAIVDAHGGGIAVGESPLDGTRVLVELPPEGARIPSATSHPPG